MVGSTGATGRPVNSSVVGTVGENFIYLRWWRVSMATRLGKSRSVGTQGELNCGVASARNE